MKNKPNLCKTSTHQKVARALLRAQAHVCVCTAIHALAINYAERKYLPRGIANKEAYRCALPPESAAMKFERREIGAPRARCESESACVCIYISLLL